ncbi:MAG: galactokinase [Candidatus Dojkabacteria bacterium]|nr:galactokinase [Candidatus Dojkabacteria bacterium]
MAQEENTIRLKRLNSKFNQIYKTKAEVGVISPGRIEIIGNHTDYNQGYAISACISNNIIALFAENNRNEIRIASTLYGKKVISFPISNSINKEAVQTWTNYARGIVQELVINKKRLSGTDILIDSTIPLGTGISSSAAFELAVAYGLLDLHGYQINNMKTAILAQNAENNYVGSPCGFLDQATIAFGEREGFVFLDFLPKATEPVSEVKIIKPHFSKREVGFVLVVDESTKRELGSSGYPARRKKCEESLPFWSSKLDREIKSLRFVTVEEFEKFKNELSRIDDEMRKRVEHVVYENMRVIDSLRHLIAGDAVSFGELMSQSGRSSINLYDLDEKTPELRFLLETGWGLEGVLGYRNMGGGFNATTLAMIETSYLDSFSKTMRAAYKNRFNKSLEILSFKICDGVRTFQM